MLRTPCFIQGVSKHKQVILDSHLQLLLKKVQTNVEKDDGKTCTTPPNTPANHTHAGGLQQPQQLQQPQSVFSEESSDMNKNNASVTPFHENFVVEEEDHVDFVFLPLHENNLPPEKHPHWWKPSNTPNLECCSPSDKSYSFCDSNSQTPPPEVSKLAPQPKVNTSLLQLGIMSYGWATENLQLKFHL